MKHFKSSKIADTELYDKLDYYDYAEFDDDYYYDLVEERSPSSPMRKRSPRRGSQYAHAFHDYIKDY